MAAKNSDIENSDLDEPIEVLEADSPSFELKEAASQPGLSRPTRSLGDEVQDHQGNSRPSSQNPKQVSIINEKSNKKQTTINWGPVCKRTVPTTESQTSKRLKASVTQTPPISQTSKRPKTKTLTPSYCLSCGFTVCRLDRHTIGRHIKNHHSKDESYKSCVSIVDQNCEMAILDRKKRNLLKENKNKKTVKKSTSSLQSCASKNIVDTNLVLIDVDKEKSSDTSLNILVHTEREICVTDRSSEAKNLDSDKCHDSSFINPPRTDPSTFSSESTAPFEPQNLSCEESNQMPFSISECSSTATLSAVSPFPPENLEQTISRATTPIQSTVDATQSIRQPEITRFLTDKVTITSDKDLAIDDEGYPGLFLRIEKVEKELSEIKSDTNFLVTKAKSNQAIRITSQESAPLENFDYESFRNCKTLNVLLEIFQNLKFYERADGGVARCIVCYQAKHLSPEDLMGLDDDSFLLDESVDQSESRKGNKETQLIYGYPISLETYISFNDPSSRTKEQNSTWYYFKNYIYNHFSCTKSGIGHINSVEVLKTKKATGNKALFATNCIINAALAVTRTKAAAIHLETLLSSYRNCGVNIGEIGHGRKQYNDCLDACLAYIRQRLYVFLTTKLPSTGLFPHFGTACDKSTLNRTTNHGMMLLVPYKGIRKAIPFGAPRVYSKSLGSVTGGTSEDLANQLFDTLVEITGIKEEQLSYHMANHSDGQYQSVGFLTALKSRTRANPNPLHDKYHVIPWDNSHWLDLAIKDLLKSKFQSSETLKTFISRVNRVATIFHRGKGREEYIAFCDHNGIKSYEINSYSTTRFFSSNYSYFLRLYCSYAGVAGTYEENRETSDSCETTKYEIRGRDFAIQLCGIIDIFKPIEKLMTKSQELNQQLWKIVSWIPKVLKILDDLEEHLSLNDLSSIEAKFFPTLAKHKEEIGNNLFRGRDLLEGWLIKSDATVSEGPKKKKETIEWVSKDDNEVLIELKLLCSDLRDSIKGRYGTCVSLVPHTLHRCFEIQDIIALCAGQRDRAKARPKLDKQGKFLTYGIENVKEFYNYVVTLPHVIELQEKDNLDLCPEAYITVYPKFKTILYEGVWENTTLLNQWFPDLKVDNSLRVSAIKVVEDNFSFEPSFSFSFSDGSTSAAVKLKEDCVFQSFYLDESVYEEAGKELCILLDEALAKGGCEAVVESLYSVMGHHAMQGGQTNETLVSRTLVDWCFPDASQ